jgi:hypothetical protein
VRQTVRLSEVREPEAPDDRLAPEQVQAVDDAAQDMAAHYNAVLTQLRAILGAATWRDAPTATLTQVGQAQAAAARAQAAQAANLAALGQSLSDSAAMVQQLSQRLDSVVAAGVGGLTQATLVQTLAQAQAVGEVMGGVRDRSNLLFTTRRPFVPSSLAVCFNGQALRAGVTADYVVVPNDTALSSTTIRLVHPSAAPYAFDVLTASYLFA